MKTEVLVLRVTEPVVPSDRGIPLGYVRDHSERSFRVECVHEDVRELSAIREEESVLAAAESIPLRLHEPNAKRELEVSGLGSVWGLRAVGADECEYSGIGARIAILDTGIDRSHKAFRDLSDDQIVEEDFTGDGNGDSDGHGTHCAGTVFGGRVREYEIGVAPGVSRALIGKVIGRDGASSTTLASAIDWALAEGANIVSMSLGIDYPGMVERLVKAGLPTDIAAARALGAYRDTVEFFSAVAVRARHAGRPVLIVAAAGNSSRSDENPDFVVGVEPPAAATGFISVGALGRRDTDSYYVANFSNSGPRISGPGVDVVSAKAGTADSLIMMSGTSMATPHVAGAAALWFERLTRTHGAGFTSELFADSVVGNASFERIEFERRRDAGKGMVRAPMN